jgi:flagellar biosynthesis/type III secretory pathway protein FliH
VTRVLKADAIRLSDAPLLGDAGEAERRQQIEDAYRAGLDDGRRAGEEAAGLALAQAATEVAAAVREAADRVAQQRAADAAAIAAIGFDVARWILGRELSDDVAAAVDRVQGILAELPDDVVHVAVHPGLIEHITADGVEADASLAPGEARVELAHGTADLTFAEAFRRAADALGVSSA